MTKKALEQALRDIAGYPLPTYTFEEKRFVPLEFADRLRTMAKEALAPRESD